MKTIRLQPIQGKFLQCTVNNKLVSIWLVDPDTNEQGTEVNYNDAIQILAFRHPVATPTPIKDEDGKLISPLTDEDREKIAAIRNGEVNEVEEKAGNDLKALVETQTKLLNAQAELIENMKKDIDELKGEKKGKAK